MEFTLSDEQVLFQESVESFTAKQYDADKRRALSESEDGFSRAHWAHFAELGWLGLGIEEAHGGLGGTALDMAVLMEGFGRALVLEPYLSSMVMGGGALELAASEKQKSALLPALGGGALLLAFAFAEPRARYDLAKVATIAEKCGGGYLLRGHKSVVLHAASADKIIVSARTAGGVGDKAGISLFLLERAAPGVNLQSYPTVDRGRAAEVVLDEAVVTEYDLLGQEGQAHAIIEAVIDRAIIAVCAEAIGIMQTLIEMTRAYLDNRKQFGIPIGKFQVLQHQLVDMYMAHELSKALTYRAAAAIASAESAARARAVSAAKVQIGKAGSLVGQQAIQLHGGMGMTDELPLGQYFKRLTMIETLFGNTDHHRRRFAALPET
ncbi:MAG: pimeloyl-CoA dehydrogenase small subunit [Rhodospirillaceae bacterium]|nr:pimeloyl-CoA dehydrogenase small subunit [Rhodospirillaceae bacterium]